MTLSLDNLNAAQRKAVIETEGPYLINAGPGAGKTRVLTHRIAYLLANEKASSYEILALTFTNRAAKEMRDRILSLLQEETTKKIWIGTFHAIFARILRIEHEAIGMAADFSIYDTQDSLQIIKTLLKERNISEEQYPPKLIKKRISNAKNQLINAAVYQQTAQLLKEDARRGKQRMAELFVAYSAHFAKANAVDFDDLLLRSYLLFINHPDLLIKWQRRFRYLLVDEFQDTNKIQYTLLKMLSAPENNLCVIGDDAQSIYAFRGANIDNILSFKRHFPAAKITCLEENYRSQPHIVALANQLIKKNSQQLPKEIFTQLPLQERVRIKQNANDIEEAATVTERIFQAHHQNHLGLDHFVILYRTHAQSRVFEERLRQMGLHYHIMGGLSFYARKEVKDLLSYLRLVVNPNDWQALERIINLPKRGIGAATLAKIKAYGQAHNVTSLVALEQLSSQFPHRTKIALQNFLKLITQHRLLQANLKIYEIAQSIAEKSELWKAWREDQTPEGIGRQENIEELLNSLQSFEQNQPKKGLAEFLQQIALMSSSDSKENKNSLPSITLATIHAVKGLEYDYVFIVGMEEGIFPSYLSKESLNGIEEERRLLYVAITRAKQELHLSYALSRYRYGKQVACRPSMFLKELEGEHIHYILPNHHQTKEISSALSGKKNSNKFSTAEKRETIASSYKLRSLDGMTLLNSYHKEDLCFIAGMEVVHPRFGKGKVVALSGVGKMQKGIVNFESHGAKKLLMAFAQFKLPQ